MNHNDRTKDIETRDQRLGQQSLVSFDLIRLKAESSDVVG